MCGPRQQGQGGQSSNGNTARNASAALQIIGSVADFVSQGQQYRANAAAALADFDRTTEALGDRAVQTRQSSAEQLVSIALQGAAQRAAARARGGSVGLSGQTVRALVQSQAVQEQRGEAITEANRDNALREIDRDLSGARITAQRRVDSVSRGSPLNLALQIGSTVANAVTAGAGG